MGREAIFRVDVLIPADQAVCGDQYWHPLQTDRDMTHMDAKRVFDDMKKSGQGVRIIRQVESVLHEWKPESTSAEG